jgi:hypothetical protein
MCEAGCEYGARGIRIKGMQKWALSEDVPTRSKSVNFDSNWLPPRDSNPDMLIQSQLSYH